MKKLVKVQFCIFSKAELTEDYHTVIGEDSLSYHLQGKGDTPIFIFKEDLCETKSDVSNSIKDRRPFIQFYTWTLPEMVAESKRVIRETAKIEISALMDGAKHLQKMSESFFTEGLLDFSR